MKTNKRISQWHIIQHDTWLLSCLTWIPILLAVSIWWIFSQGVARDIHFGIVDFENSPLSRQFVRELDASPSLKIVQNYLSVADAKDALVQGDIYAYAVIPKRYSRDIYLNNQPQVSVFYNSQYILIGKLINSAVQQVHGAFNAKLDIAKQLAKGNTTIIGAAGKTVTIRNKIVPLFNQNSNYAQFLVSAIVPALWQIMVIISTILALSANYRIYGLARMLGTAPFRNIAKIMAFYSPFFLVLGVGFLVWFYLGLSWPMVGTLFPIIYAQILTILACIIMGSVFFFLTLDPARAMSFAGAFTAPSFAFMGITFPESDMTVLASTWRSFLPVSHYIDAQIGQSSYGVTTNQAIIEISTNMAGYLIPLALVYLLCKKHLKKQGNEL